MQNVLLIEDLSDGQKVKLASNTDDFAVLMADSYLFDSSAISETESKILKLIFIGGYSAAEIAKIENITRQAVNQTKKRALEQIRKELCK